MSSVFLKTAIGASLAVHAAGLGLLIYVQLPQRPAASVPTYQPFVLTITAVPDETVNADTVSLSPPPTQPVEPVAVPKPEVVPIPPPLPQPERISAPPKEIALLPEPPIMPMPDLLSTQHSVTPASAPAQPVVAAPPVSSRTTETSVTQATPAPRGERIISRAQPNYRKNSERIYPAEAIHRHEEGLVIVTADLDVRGIPQKVALKQSSGYLILDDAALRAVRSWEFEPARLDGRAVASTVEVPVNFKLSN